MGTPRPYKSPEVKSPEYYMEQAKKVLQHLYKNTWIIQIMFNRE